MATNNTQVSYSDYVRKFWKLFGYTFGGILLFFLLASWGFFGKMPSFDELENPDTNIATEIISSDGVTLGKFYKENRTPVKYQDLPKHLVDALVATEDERFYEHSGIDVKATVRAAAMLGKEGGGSTITQQLAKLFFTENASKNIMGRILQKSKEWVIAIRLEERYTKEEIITMYFNEYDFYSLPYPPITIKEKGEYFDEYTNVVDRFIEIEFQDGRVYKSSIMKDYKLCMSHYKSELPLFGYTFNSVINSLSYD